MKLIDPSFEILETYGYDLNSIYKDTERAGRVCYKSEDKCTEDSAKPFVNMLIKRGHTSPLEQGTVYLTIPWDIKGNSEETFKLRKIIAKYESNPYTKIVDSSEDKKSYITTNYRVIQQNKLENDLKYLANPTEFHKKRISVKFICSRAILAEFTRHRVFSFCVESQRYVNYSKDRFGNQITYIKPEWVNAELGGHSNELIIISNAPKDGYIKGGETYLISLYNAEKWYFDLLKLGWKPQQAREVLPNSTKTEIVMTGYIDDWKEFFKLRCDKAAHPEARRLAIPLKEEFIKRNLID